MGACNCTHYSPGVEVDLLRHIGAIAGWTEVAVMPQQQQAPHTNTSSSSDGLGSHIAAAAGAQRSISPIGQKGNRTFSFKCDPDLNVFKLLTKLITNDTLGECAMGIGSITITRARIEMGARWVAGLLLPHNLSLK